MRKSHHQVIEARAYCMPEDYTIHPYDVLNGRGKMAFSNVGNRRFRITLALTLTKYQTAPNRQEKTRLIISIIELVRRNGGRFLTRSKGRWVDIGDRAAREKVGHAFRDMVGAHVAKQRKQAERARSRSPTCVVQDPNESVLDDPLDAFFSGMFLEQHIQDYCDALPSEDQNMQSVDV